MIKPFQLFLPIIGCFFQMLSVKIFCWVQLPECNLYEFAKSKSKAQVTSVGFVNICFEITVLFSVLIIASYLH